MTKEELFNAFREVASEEFAHIPDEDDIDYEFSERFNKKMDKLFKRIERNCSYPTDSLLKRIIAVSAAILIVFAGLMSVSAIRKPVVNFVLEFFEKYIDFGFSGDVSQEIEYEYGFSEIPEGFELITKISDYDIAYCEYKNKSTDAEIIFEQTISDGKWISVDNEHGKTTIEQIGKTQVFLYEGIEQNYYQANWTIQTYSLTMIHYGDIEKDAFLDLVESIK